MSDNDEFAAPEDKGYYAVFALDTGLGARDGMGVVWHLHSDTDPTALRNQAPDGEYGWKSGNETDSRLEVMSLLANTDNGSNKLVKTTYVWFDGVKYTINWDLELSPTPAMTAFVEP